MSPLSRQRDLIWYLARREIAVRYRRSVIGGLWTVLQPLLLLLVWQVVFSYVFRAQVASYPVYALSGLLFWNFFQHSVISSMNSLRRNAQILLLLPLRCEVFPIAVVVAGTVNLLLSLGPLLLVALLTGPAPTWALLILPLSILVAAVFTLGVSLALAPAAVFFADVAEAVGILLAVLLYLTPVFYPASIVPEPLRWLVSYNPLALVLAVFRDPFHRAALPAGHDLLLALLSAALSLAAGVAVFSRSRRRIPFYV